MRPPQLCFLLVLSVACRHAPPEPVTPAAVAAAQPGQLYRLETYGDGFREDESREVPIGVPRSRPSPVASVDLESVAAGDILLITAAYTVESRTDSTNLGISTTISLADHPEGYREGDREILGFGSHNLTNHGDVYPHYGTPSFTTIYRVRPGDERLRYVNLVTWIGTDDVRQEGRRAAIRRAQIDVLRFARSPTVAHASR